MPASAEYMDLPFEEAIRFFREKVNLPTETWKDLWQGMHARAFGVAGAMKDDLLADFRKAIDKGISKGTTIQEFRKDFDKIVQRHGWKYKGNRGWRTGVIFNTNLRTAYAAGHHKTMTEPSVLKARPYWRYVASSAREPREEHRKWYNLVLPHDHEFWKTHRPPNGWGCKCGLVNHSASEVERLKKEEAGGPYPIRTDTPRVETREWVDKTTGEAHQIPKGIDPGWDYNVGEAAWGRTQALRLMEENEKWSDLDAFGPEKYGRPPKIDRIESTATRLAGRVAVGNNAALYEALRKVLGGDERTFVDPTGTPISASLAIVDHIIAKPEKRWNGREQYFPLIPETIESPYEIWVGFAKSDTSGRIAVRRKYVKAFKLKGKKIVGIVADTVSGQWVGVTFFSGKLTGAGNLRKGRLLWWVK